MIQFEKHSFQMGWFNHQLDLASVLHLEFAFGRPKSPWICLQWLDDFNFGGGSMFILPFCLSHPVYRCHFQYLIYIYEYNLYIIYIYIYQNDLHVIIYQLATVYGTGPSKQNGLGLEAGEGGFTFATRGMISRTSFELSHLKCIKTLCKKWDKRIPTPNWWGFFPDFENPSTVLANFGWKPSTNLRIIGTNAWIWRKKSQFWTYPAHTGAHMAIDWGNLPSFIQQSLRKPPSLSTGAEFALPSHTIPKESLKKYPWN